MQLSSKRIKRFLARPIVIGVIVLMLFLLSLLAFFWGEWDELSFNKKINHDKLSAYFQMVGSIVTAVSIYLLYKQFTLQRKQHQPRLFVEEIGLRVQIGIESARPQMKILNKGNEIALYINIEWELFEVVKDSSRNTIFYASTKLHTHIEAHESAVTLFPTELTSAIDKLVEEGAKQWDVMRKHSQFNRDVKVIQQLHPKKIGVKVNYEDSNGNNFDKRYVCDVTAFVYSDNTCEISTKFTALN